MAFMIDKMVEQYNKIKQ